MAAAVTLRTPFRAGTYATLIGLLAVTGLRVGEAIRLDVADLDTAEETLTIRTGKFGKSRLVPLHPTSVAALRRYLARHDRPRFRYGTHRSGTSVRYAWARAKPPRRSKT